LTTARVIVLSGTGPHFSAGLDLSSFSGGGETDESVSERHRRL